MMEVIGFHAQGDQPPEQRLEDGKIIVDSP
jgi:hypothetical protein